MEDKPLILVTNDDGISSVGLWSAVEALLPLGEVLVVAPDRQWSGGGRSMPSDVTGRLQHLPREVDGVRVDAYAVDASPALAVVHGVVELASRRPALVVSGVNFGANLGSEVTISGTVGAALEGGAFGIPALAVSQEMDAAFHLTGDETVDYAAAAAFTRQFAALLLDCVFPQDVYVWSVNIPAQASPQTSWRLTRLARGRYFVPMPPDRSNGSGRPGYRMLEDLKHVDPASDIWAVLVDKVVSATPLSLDLTSRVNFDFLAHWMGAGQAALISVTASSCGISIPDNGDDVASLDLFATCQLAT